MKTNIVINTRGVTEKAAALFIYSQAVNKPVQSCYANHVWGSNPYVGYVKDTDSITGASESTYFDPAPEVINYDETLTPESFRERIYNTMLIVKLNNEYDAEVSKDGTVKVGCQYFKIKQIESIIEAYKSLNS